MNLFALLLGLGIERLLTQLFHLREFRWLDPIFDWACHRLRGRSSSVAMLGTIVLTVVLAAPVAVVSYVLGDSLFHLPYFVFAVVVLLFSLGPRDLKEEVNEYCTALDAEDAETINRVAKELLEAEPPADAGDRAKRVERSIFVQANNRIFGVAFWFIVLGPPGAWLFRVLDLLRRRVAYQHAGSNGLDYSVRLLHALLAWIPARLLAGGYALAGSFEEAIADWRGYYQNCAPHMFDVNNDVLSSAGMGAAGRAAHAVELTPSAGARAAMSLVSRTLWLWCAVIAVLTLLNIVS